MKIAVAGANMQNSLLPDILRAGLKSAGIVGAVTLHDSPTSEFETLVHQLVAEGYRGMAVAHPHKSAAAHLAARFFTVRHSMGVANGLTFENGKIFAQNTEVPAIQGLLQGLEPSTALLLGAGSGARSVAVALMEAGWKLRLWNRNGMRARLLQTTLLRYGPIELLPQPEPIGCTLVINATALGAKAGEKAPLDWKFVRRGVTAMDIVYRRVPTEFLREAKLRGCATIDGRQIVVEKAALSMEQWLERSLERQPMLEAAGLRGL